MSIITVGIDLAKNIFAVHGANKTVKSSSGFSTFPMHRKSVFLQFDHPLWSV